EFIDFVLHNGELDFFMEEIEVKERSHFQGLTIGEARARNQTNANILAIKKKKENRLIAGPEPEVAIEEGDLLIILGTKGQLKEMERLIASA
ncbi:MAG TPA: TrkA C-terminal domain-containing protein, partial [Nitrospiria bacterium]|nr:TrkA C-terminal domain-containing protein [Nitrospiria bacterium]